MSDTLARLDTDVDLWVATAGATPHLIPLSFLWDGATLLISTPEASPTGRNLRATGRVRLGFGPTVADVAHVKAVGIDKYIAEQLAPSSTPENPDLTERVAALDTLKVNPVPLFVE